MLGTFEDSQYNSSEAISNFASVTAWRMKSKLTYYNLQMLEESYKLINEVLVDLNYSRHLMKAHQIY